MMNIEWQIEWLRKLPQVAHLPDVVVECGWRVTVVQAGASATAYGSVTLPLPSVGEAGFTAFEDLTAPQVLAWVWESGIDRALVEADLARQVAHRTVVPVAIEPPWGAQ